jgi:hypothetical protein
MIGGWSVARIEASATAATAGFFSDGPSTKQTTKKHTKEKSKRASSAKATYKTTHQ